MLDTTPPPTLFRTLAAPAEVVERLTTLWRLATTDDQRHELERLAEAIHDDATSLHLEDYMDVVVDVAAEVAAENAEPTT